MLSSIMTIVTTEPRMACSGRCVALRGEWISAHARSKVPVRQIPVLEVALRRGGVHVSRTVVTRWFAARTGAASAVPGVWVILHSLWAAGLGFCMPGSRFIRSVPSPAAALCNFAPRAGGEGETSRLAAGAGRGVYVCPVDPQHGQDGDVVHIERVLLEKSSIRPVRHPPAGVSWWGD